jgi:hypothetical protein
MARAIASGGIANLSMDATIWAFASEIVMDPAKFVRVKPGEGFGKAADIQGMPHPRGRTES